MDADTPRGLRARLRRRPIPERTSEVLRDLAERARSERITFREILTELRHRALGFTLLIFALPCCLPMPPGIPTVCGVALVIIAAEPDRCAPTALAAERDRGQERRAGPT